MNPNQNKQPMPKGIDSEAALLERGVPHTKAGELQAMVDAKAPKAGTIPVKSLTFFLPHPDLNARSSISAQPGAHHGRVSIEFVPSLRHHRLEITPPGAVTPRVLFIYEGHVAGWEPLT